MMRQVGMAHRWSRGAVTGRAWGADTAGRRRAAVPFVTGFIWTTQVVHYPLFDRVGEETFPSYQTDNNRLYLPVAGQSVLATLLVPCCSSSHGSYGCRSPGGHLGARRLRAVFQAAQHRTLSSGFDQSAYRLL